MTIRGDKYLMVTEAAKLVSVGDPTAGGLNLLTCSKSLSMNIESPRFGCCSTNPFVYIYSSDCTECRLQFTRTAWLGWGVLINPRLNEAIRDNVFSLSWQGLGAHGGNTLFNNLAHENICGLYATGNAEVSNCTLDRNETGLKVYAASQETLVIRDSLFSKNADEGILIDSGAGDIVNYYNAFWENGEDIAGGSLGNGSQELGTQSCPYHAWTHSDWQLRYKLNQGSSVVDAGSRSAKYGGLSEYSTSVDADTDVKNLDMGYHWATGQYADTDEDGMPDAWETEHACYDPAGDDDSDGLSNLEEYLHGTDPDLQDTDGDGTNDGTELSQGTMDPAHWSLYYEPYVIKMEYSGATQKCSLTIKWRSTQPYEGKIKYREETGDWVQAQEGTSRSDHRLDIGNLDADATHFYRVLLPVVLPGDVSESWTLTSVFRTPPATGSSIPFKFIIYGDNRTHPQRHRDVVHFMLDNSFDVFDPPRFLLHSGDYTSGNTNDQWLAEFFKPVAGLLPAMPIYPCAGNHEYPSISQFRTRFPCDWYKTGSSDPCYLYFDYGRCRFIVYDTQNLGTEQKNWLSARIDGAANDPNLDWTFVVLHVPLYTDAEDATKIAHEGTIAGYHRWEHADVSNVRSNLSSTLGNKTKLKMVFCGHNHFYERSFTEGADHVTTGGGGAPGSSGALHHRPPSASAEELHPEYQTREYAEGVFHHCLVEVNGTDLIFKAVRNDGSILDFDAHNTNGQRLWDGNPGRTTPVDFEAQWKYKQGTNLDGIPWQLPDYDDSAWSTGGAPLGFGWTGPGTQLTGTYPTYYFRHTIAEDLSGDLTSIEFLFLELHLDDGCAVYLNGSEVFRSNLAPGATYWTGAQNSVDSGYDEEPLRCLIDHSLLRAGSNANVVAVEVHNKTHKDSDLRFDLRLGYFKNNWRTQ